MRKITLRLESLHVDSFATSSLLSGAGTVVAFDDCEQTAFSDIKPSEGGNCGTHVGNTCKCPEVHA